MNARTCPQTAAAALRSHSGVSSHGATYLAFGSPGKWRRTPSIHASRNKRPWSIIGNPPIKGRSGGSNDSSDPVVESDDTRVASKGVELRLQRPESTAEIARRMRLFRDVDCGMAVLE